jgi:hypothetical protein
MHTPAVLLANEGFVTDGRSAASNKGMPGVRIVSEPVPCECSIMEEAQAGIAQVMDQIIEALTKPLTAEEKSPQPKEKDNPSRIIFRGNIEEINRFFYKRGWGDGLPLMPPTEGAVKEMLTGTDLPPEHIVGKVEPRLGKATVEKIAVNACMAGALPTHMPVLIACVEAILDPLSRFGTFGPSTGSWSPFWVINGPIRNDIHVNSSTGALSPGDIANAAIGRAMGLIIKNIGGARKGIEDMGVLGNPGKYSMVIGEDEEKSPWEPLHTDQGLDRNESAVSFFCPNSYTQVWPYGSDDKGILNSLTYNLQPGRGGLSCFILTPVHARALVQKGWTKDMVRKYVSEFARVPAYRHPRYYDTNKGIARQGTVPMNAMDPLAIIPNSDYIRILVAGGPGAFIGLVCGAALGGNRWVTKRIELPAQWGKLVAKYRAVVPTYERY